MPAQFLFWSVSIFNVLQSYFQELTEKKTEKKGKEKTNNKTVNILAEPRMLLKPGTGKWKMRLIDWVLLSYFAE